MAAAKGPKSLRRVAKRDVRDAEVYGRWLNGETHSALAQAYGVGVKVICRACKRARDEFARDRFETVDQIKREQTIRIECVRREAMKAWKRSNRNKKPDYQALDIVLRTENRLAKLWGIDAPEQKQVNHSGGLLMGFMPKTEIEERLAARSIEIEAQEAAELESPNTITVETVNDVDPET